MDIITIDGLSGTGKTARAKDLAKKLDYNYLGIGYIFRTLAYLFIYSDNYQKAINNLNYSYSKQTFKIYLHKKNITSKLHGDKLIDRFCSEHANNDEIYLLVKKIIHNIVKCDNWVIEGRSASSLFPTARIKFILECSQKERKKRVLLEMLNNGLSKDEAYQIYIESKKRNIADLNSFKPLRCGIDTTIIDSTYLTPEQTLNSMLMYCNNQFSINCFLNNNAKSINNIMKQNHWLISKTKSIEIEENRIVIELFNRLNITDLSEQSFDMLTEHLFFHSFSNDVIVYDINNKLLYKNEVKIITNLYKYINTSLFPDYTTTNEQKNNNSRGEIHLRRILSYNCFRKINQVSACSLLNSIINGFKKDTTNKSIITSFICEKNDNINDSIILIQNEHYKRKQPTLFILETNKEDLIKWNIIIQTILKNIPIICIDNHK